jgi:signal transduction histidine kinase
MSARIAKTITGSVWALTAGLVAGGIVLTTLNRSTVDGNTASFYPILWLSAVSFVTVGSLIARRHPSNPIGWLFCVMGVGLAGLPFGQEYAIRGITTAPGSLPAPNWIGYETGLLFVFAVGPIGLVFLLYPNGRALSRKWRAVVWILSAALVASTIINVFDPHTTNGINDRLPEHAGMIPNPIGISALRGVLEATLQATGFVIVLASLAAVVSLIIRLRRASGVERQQVRWLAYTGAATLLLFPLFPLALALNNNQVLGSVFWISVTLILLLGIPAASGIAILKYRLYDLDVVVKKTVVFGSLLAFGTLVYLAVVVGIGAAIGNKGNAALTLAAAAIVAISFQPLRARARRLADRLVYGRRATPYEVLSEFSDRMAASYSTEDVLPRMAQILGEGTGSQRAGVWLRMGSEARLTASWPPLDGEGTVTEAVAIDDLDRLPGGDRTFPVQHRGELLGALTVVMPPTEPLTPSQEKLVGDLASQAGLVLRNVRLIEELRASRQRLVAAQDEERRRLERNLHDGAQQQLVALAVKVKLAQAVATRDPQKAEAMLSEVQSDAQDALENLRDLARGIYPPLLADQGLPAALQAQARKAPMPVTVDATSIGRYPQEAEAAVYFCCLEALQNVAKYADASSVHLKLGIEDAELTFEVSDDGRGFDAATTPLGSGMQNMTDRLAALGGSIEVQSNPGTGTTVRGRIPVRP